uniref:Enkurin domain-containing protein n=1 Tax=Neobodo designis TaxID=312471 RepID=A0A7S1MQR1_NEODS|mmetsp:Transcript_45172/g.139371  ORF Transcript_45172/g.139371 Transcript_45172/m.139371 type:complete len:261 (+) Transcript_45172:30-812(+)|eukprot:CAMPEP_0174850222 /NCGR_PEP_ID=MMETSP1114-20130205/19105_1 /TAXON_ID=312471 /ORGANISM="Neobodo designis, Strain CCAP 1951/1" /LENGTH=260 /DNA_ID=CAMNT_0016084661 /DNA_START=30 /DNA_END=812 /DNA_ORIENTATION=+
MNESVYAIIPPKAEARAAPPMYRSKHRNLVPSCSTFGLHGTSKVLGNVAGDRDDAPEVHPAVKPTGSFGKPVSHTINPKDFLKKTNAAGASQSKYGTTFKRAPTNPKPSVPTKSDRPVMGLKTDKNFVVANAVESVLTAPKRTVTAEDRAVDKQNFGQVPGYLTKIKAELKSKASTKEATLAATGQTQDDFEVMSSEEVEQLRAALQARLDNLNKQFQTLSFTLETGTQKKRKETLEKSIDDIEQMLSKLNKRRVLVVDQ